jgi:hypothetical protein
LEFELASELKELQERARRFVEQELMPHEMTVEDCEVGEEQILGGIGEANSISKSWFRGEPRIGACLAASVPHSGCSKKPRCGARSANHSGASYTNTRGSVGCSLILRRNSTRRA